MPTRRDPTCGTVERDLQWLVFQMAPDDIGLRVALEHRYQEQRDVYRAKGR